jgi:GT2 family glycosyltransferase
VLVDNASQDGTPRRVAELFPDVKVVSLPRNLGAVGRNVGVAQADTPYVAFADDDSWWEPGALDRAADVLDSHPEIGLLAARILVGDQGVLEPVCADMERSALGVHGDEPGPRVLGFIACGAVVRRSAFVEAGGFDPVVFFAGEEERLALDLAARGWVLCYAPDVVARHVPSRSRAPRARRVRIARNIVLTALMRRPLRQVLLTLARTARSRQGVQGLLAAIPRVPAALRARRPLPPEVETSRQLLDASAS